ncbi:hypothetical protein A4G99_21000 [Haladaptatus sp. R4]|uniref:HalOD1 output domain-containing protein n=1 Tax=Haladaptatus sp. R4 TaxID=1679489 RepID=UPI0007B4D483|nr:HalOD1 output domain-containing protein [Haladaptatus sp. R4]KZN26519.1 hypothetical protein A4G99_21000 [Haladaptatus sp. R4]
MTDSTNPLSDTPQPIQPKLTDGGETDSLPVAIVREVAAEKEVETSSLPPIYETINPDALEELFDSPLDGTSQTTGRIVFEYSGCRVVVTSTGAVQATLLDDGQEI